MQLKFLSILLKTCLFTLQLKLIAPKFITSGWRTSTFEQFISDYFAFTLNPNKSSSNLGTSTSIPASRTDVGTDPSAGCWVTIPCSDQVLESLSHSRGTLIPNVTPLSQALEYFTVQLQVPKCCGSQVGINSWELRVRLHFIGGRAITAEDLSRSASAQAALMWWSDTATHHFYYLLNIWNANWWKRFYCLEMLLLGGVHFDYYEKIQFSAFFSDTPCSV